MLCIATHTHTHTQFCQQALQSVQHCLYLPTEGSGSGVLLPGDVALKAVLVLLLVMERVRKKGKADKEGCRVWSGWSLREKSLFAEARLSMLRAYVLALFSHFITKFLGDLHVGLFGPESLLELFEEKPEEAEEVGDDPVQPDRADAADGNGPKVEQPAKKKKKASKLDRFKRRRRKAKGSLEDEEDEVSSDLSEEGM